MSRKDCPRAKSSMTPCYLRDGDMVVVEAYYGKTKVCVGCEASIEKIKATATDNAAADAASGVEQQDSL